MVSAKVAINAVFSLTFLSKQSLSLSSEGVIVHVRRLFTWIVFRQPCPMGARPIGRTRHPDDQFCKGAGHQRRESFFFSGFWLFLISSFARRDAKNYSMAAKVATWRSGNRSMTLAWNRRSQLAVTKKTRFRIIVKLFRIVLDETGWMHESHKVDISTSGFSPVLEQFRLL